MAAKKKQKAPAKAKTAKAPKAKAKAKKTNFAKATAAVKKAAKNVVAKAKEVASKATAVKWMPKGYHSVNAHLIVKGAADALDFYKRAFGAEELARMPMPGGMIGHAEMKIGDTIFMLADEFPDMGSLSPKSLGGSGSSLMIYTPDVDSLFAQAVAAGATVKMPVQDQFWGDRYGTLTDPFGHSWSIATHKEDVSVEEMARRAAAMPPPA